MVLTISLTSRDLVEPLPGAREESASQITRTTASMTETASFRSAERTEAMLVKGDSIRVVSGKYRNTRGYFIRYTKQMVWVSLSMSNGSLTTCLGPNSIKKLSAVEKEAIGSSEHPKLVKGDSIQVISGTHVNERGYFIRYTPKKVWVRISTSNGPLTTCLRPSSIRKISAAAEDESSSSGRPKLVEGDSIQVISGKYKNKQGYFIRYTAQKVWVRLYRSTGPITTCLWPSSIQKVDSSAAPPHSRGPRPSLAPKTTSPSSRTSNHPGNSGDTYEEDDRVLVISGKYKDMKGRFLRRTPQKMWIEIKEAGGRSIKTCLFPGAIRKVGPSREKALSHLPRALAKTALP